ncbi:FAD-dependent oxidoreductase [Taklimakanibacter deserti]|uniref:FAD-dependent oxidoreductase n=1 Tax=Taklimakanibacter deserti TaxID=2267839 RepID=UPI000E64B5B0
MSQTIHIDFEGERIAAQAGESLAAALIAHGITTLRTTRQGAERSVFCGMGICQDCLVEVDGKPNQRACMTVIDRPLEVRREAHARPLAAAAPEGKPPVTVDDIAVERPELLIIGAGPGGLAAAIAARRAGAEVTVVDERAHAGGQFFKQLAVEGGEVAEPDAQHREGAELIAAARSLGVELRSGVTVWGAFAPNDYAASVAGRTVRFEPKATIIATGAYERGWPVPGWTLPGVMTTGAAQTLWRMARRLPGKRVLIAGNGPLNLQLAAELIAGGAEVAAVVEAAPRPGLSALGALLTMLLDAPGLVRDGLRYDWARRAGKARMVHGTVVAGVEKIEAGLRVRLDSDEVFDVDVLCLGYGFEPSNELLRMLGAGHDYDPERRQLVTRCDANGLTDIAHVYALGDCTGLGGVRIALAQGTLSGLAAAAALGHALTTQAADLRAKAASNLARHRRFQRALWHIYRASPWTAKLARSDTLICRCEEVSLAEIETALAEDLQAIGAVKRRTRLGMGRCQGRYCAPILDAMLAERCGRARAEFSGFAPRPPARPVSIADLVG